MIRLFVFSVCAALLLMIVKELKPEYAKLGGILVTLIISISCIGLLADLVSHVKALTEAGVTEYVNVLLKVAGVCICVDISSDLCAECGYHSVSKSVLLYGKAQLILIIFPYIQKLIAGVSSFF
ncbi:MAG: hypothetical protein HFE78_03855 [Clostridiales bacterium]|nr:hypothetical protein [Clostridiales bacterium]